MRPTVTQKKNKTARDLGSDKFYTKQDFLAEIFSFPTLLLTFYIGFDDFVSELINKRTSTKRDFSIIAESKPYAHHRTHLHAMIVYNTRPVSLTIEVLFIKIVFFFQPLK